MNMPHLMHKRFAMPNSWLLQCKTPVHQHVQYMFYQKAAMFLAAHVHAQHAYRWQDHWQILKENRLMHLRRGKDTFSVQGEVRAHVCCFEIEALMQM